MPECTWVVIHALCQDPCAHAHTRACTHTHAHSVVTSCSDGFSQMRQEIEPTGRQTDRRGAWPASWSFEWDWMAPSIAAPVSGRAPASGLWDL